MKVVVHIGSPKTGSSALQYFLNDNRRQLARHGYYYPKHNFDSNQVSGGHGSLARLIDDGDIGNARDQLDTWLKVAARKKLTLLLSAEGFYTQAKTLLPLLQGYEVKVVAFVRNPVEFIVANHNQSIKRHFSTETLQDVLARVPDSRNRGVNGELLAEWSEAVGRQNFTGLAYHKNYLPKGRVEFAFLKWLGISGFSMVSFRVPKRLINTSYTPESLELKRLINTVSNPDDRILNQQIDRALQSYSDQLNARSDRVQVGLPVCPEILQRAYLAFSDSNNQLLKPLLAAQPKGFLDIPSNFPEPEPLDITQVVTLYRRLNREQPDITHQLRKRVIEKLNCSVGMHAIYRLADIMGIPYSEPVLFDDRLMSVLRNNGLDAADYLRELAHYLVKSNHKEEALNVIRQAEKIRPKGEVIKKLRASLEKEFCTNKRFL